jgi:serine/threonine-protein kinase
MGAVFRAHHELMDRDVALKYLHPEHSTRDDSKVRFIREARAAARIRHPNVVEVQDVGEHDGALFMVMELLEGDSFADLIKAQRLPVKKALSILIDAMEGVAAAHARGIVHRDIKPENIFVARRTLSSRASEPPPKSGAEPLEVVKILDFGVSKLTDGAGGTGSVTQNGQAVGTPEYMAPEQMLGEPDVDARADVYSFGVLLYRVLTGEPPFRGENFAAIAVQVATQTPVSPRELRPEIPLALERIVMRSMARNRDERYASLRALIDALRPVSTGDALSLLMPLATHVAARGSSIARDVVSRSGRRAVSTVWAPVMLGLLLAMWARWQRQGQAPEARAPRAAETSAPAGVERNAPAGVERNGSAAPPSAPLSAPPATTKQEPAPLLTPEAPFVPQAQPQAPVAAPLRKPRADGELAGDAGVDLALRKRNLRAVDGGVLAVPHPQAPGAQPPMAPVPAQPAPPADFEIPTAVPPSPYEDDEPPAPSTATGLRSGTLDRNEF